MTEYTLEQCLEQQKKVDASIKHNGEYMPWLAGIKEVIEMCDHLSMIDTWKKQPEPDMRQAFMELVDVFAFAMSKFDKRHNVDFELKNLETKGFKVELTWMIKEVIEAFARSGTVSEFYSIRSMCNLFFKRPVEDIYYYYMGKQTLTQFRQASGYKDGSYNKKWGGREDNEYLTDALENGVEIDDLFEHLSEVYNRLVIAKAVAE